MAKLKEFFWRERGETYFILVVSYTITDAQQYQNLQQQTTRLHPFPGAESWLALRAVLSATMLFLY